MKDLPKYLRLLLLVTATMPLWYLGHPLWEVDDARYAEVPREMAETGDWITPHLDYVDYVQKPPLIYWLTAISYKTFGVSESASRLPLVLLGWLGMFGVYWLGSWLFSVEAAAWGTIILGSCAQFFILTHLNTPDPALAVCLLWATAFILRALLRPKDSTWAAPAAGAALGLAFLAKGLVAWLLPVVWVGAMFVLSSEVRASLKPRSVLVSALVAIAVAAPWLWAMSVRHPRFLEHFFIEQHFRRFLTAQYNRPGPWYYFLVVEIVGLLPWTPLTIGAIAIAAAGWRRLPVGELGLLLWTGLVLAFFTVSHSKLPTYILPLFPQQCLIAARLLVRLSKGELKAVWLDRLHLGLGIALWVCAPIAVFLLRRQPSPIPLTPEIYLAGATLIVALGAGWIFPKLLPWSAFLIAECLLIGARAAEPWLSVRTFSQEIVHLCPTQAPLIAYDVYLHGVPFYAHRRVDKLVNWIGEFDYEKSDPKFASMFGDDETIRELGRKRRPACVILQKREQAYFASLVPPKDLAFVRSTGPWELAILDSAAR